jgi:hypothetical protein
VGDEKESGLAGGTSVSELRAGCVERSSSPDDAQPASTMQAAATMTAASRGSAWAFIGFLLYRRRQGERIWKSASKCRAATDNNQPETFNPLSKRNLFLRITVTSFTSILREVSKPSSQQRHEVSQRTRPVCQ